MFANKDMFGDRSSHGRVQLREGGFKADEPKLSVDGNGNIDMHEHDHNGGESMGFDSMTPAARKKKMMEQRRAMLNKKKKKLQSAGMLRSSSGRSTAPRQVRSESSSAASTTRSYTSSRYYQEEEEIPEGKETAFYTGSTTAGLESLIAEREKKRQSKDLSTVERDMKEMGIAPTFDPTTKKKKFNAFPSRQEDEDSEEEESAQAAGVSSSVQLGSPRSSPQDYSLRPNDLQSGLTSPLPFGTTMKCYITRNKSGIRGKFYPLYELYMEEGNTFLLAAKRRSRNKTSNYLISMDAKDLSKDGSNYVGKVRSNFVGTEFLMFDKGVNPKDVGGAKMGDLELGNVRQELGAVLYQSNILGHRGPRKMTAIVPTVDKKGKRAVSRPLTEKDGLLPRFKAGDMSDMYLLTNKPPKWNETVGAYVLNFQGRVTMASVKNFQLCCEDIEDGESVILQFGRVSKDTFTMDLSWPLSPLQAFAITLSSFDYKLACE